MSLKSQWQKRSAEEWITPEEAKRQWELERTFEFGGERMCNHCPTRKPGRVLFNADIKQVGTLHLSHLDDEGKIWLLLIQDWELWAMQDGKPLFTIWTGIPDLRIQFSWNNMQNVKVEDNKINLAHLIYEAPVIVP